MPYGCSHSHHHHQGKQTEPRNCLAFQQELLHRHSSRRIFPSPRYVPDIWAKPRADKKSIKQQSRKSCGLWKRSRRAPLLHTKDNGRPGQQREKLHVQWYPQELKSVGKDRWQYWTFSETCKVVFCIIIHTQSLLPFEGRGTTHIWGAAASNKNQGTLSCQPTLCSLCPRPPSLTHFNTIPIPISSISTGNNCASSAKNHFF